MERADVEDALRSLDQIRAAYRREIEMNEDKEFIDDLADIIDTAERWLLDQIGAPP